MLDVSIKLLHEAKVKKRNVLMSHLKSAEFKVHLPFLLFHLGCLLIRAIECSNRSRNTLSFACCP